MGYNIIDIIDKLILIEEKAVEIYQKICENKDCSLRFKAISNILMKEELRHIKYYNELKEKFIKSDLKDISLHIYDKISKLIDKFRNNMDIPQTGDYKVLLKGALELEKKNVALLISIQGSLVTSEKDVNRVAYNILSEMIKEEQRHVKNLEPYVEEV